MSTPIIVVDLSGDLSKLADELNLKIQDFARAAVARTAETLATRWREAVRHAPGIRPDERTAYSGAIDWDFDPGNVAAATVKTTFANAHLIENGRPAFDMHRILQTSIRTKLSKDGRRYLTIPMRHNTPGSDAHAPDMPADIFKRVEGFKMSRITGSVMRPNANGRLVPRNTYDWGDKLRDKTAGRYAGMVRMLGGTDKNGKKSGEYLTFRTLAEGSLGWIRPAQPGLYLLRDITAYTQAELPDLLRKMVDEML